MAVAAAGGLTVMVIAGVGGERIEVGLKVCNPCSAATASAAAAAAAAAAASNLLRPQQHHQHQQHGATATNDVIVAPDADNTLRACTCDERCCKGFLWVGGSYCSAITAAALFTIVLALVGLAALGLVIMAFAPAAVVLYWAWKWYGRYLTRCTIADVMLEATAILLVPLIVAISFIDYYLPMTTMCGASNPNAPVYRYFFQAFVRAAWVSCQVLYPAAPLQGVHQTRGPAGVRHRERPQLECWKTSPTPSAASVLPSPAPSSRCPPLHVRLHDRRLASEVPLARAMWRALASPRRSGARGG